MVTYEEILRQKELQEEYTFQDNWDKLEPVVKARITKEGFTLKEWLDINEEYEENFIVDMAVKIRDSSKDMLEFELQLADCIGLAAEIVKQNKHKRLGGSCPKDKKRIRLNFIKMIDNEFWENRNK